MAVVTQLFMPLNDAVPQILYRGRGIVHIHEDAVGRQILEQMRGALEEQRQEVFDAARRYPCAHVAVDGLLRQIAGESQAVAAAELAHGFRDSAASRAPAAAECDPVCPSERCVSGSKRRMLSTSRSSMSIR